MMLQTSPSPNQSLPEARELPTDEELADIASKVHRRDWQRLANKLGFLDSDIKQFEQQRGNNEQKVLTQHAMFWCHPWHHTMPLLLHYHLALTFCHSTITAMPLLVNCLLALYLCHSCVPLQHDDQLAVFIPLLFVITIMPPLLDCHS